MKFSKSQLRLLALENIFMKLDTNKTCVTFENGGNPVQLVADDEVFENVVSQIDTRIMGVYEGYCRQIEREDQKSTAGAEGGMAAVLAMVSAFVKNPTIKPWLLCGSVALVCKALYGTISNFDNRRELNRTRKFLVEWESLRRFPSYIKAFLEINKMTFDPETGRLNHDAMIKAGEKGIMSPGDWYEHFEKDWVDFEKKKLRGKVEGEYQPYGGYDAMIY